MKNLLTLNIFCLILLLPEISGCKKTSTEQTVKPEQFTTAAKIDLLGCGNLYKVSDALYRGEQPTAEGFKELEKLGIKTVVSLRSLHSDRDELKGTSLAYEHIRMEA